MFGGWLNYLLMNLELRQRNISPHGRLAGTDKETEKPSQTRAGLEPGGGDGNEKASKATSR